MLIKEVKNAKSEFAMICFKFTKKNCEGLDRAIAEFWWGHKEEGGKIHWQVWRK